MLPRIADFQAEADALRTMLLSVPDSDWARPGPFNAGTINDILQYLHDGDLLAAASAAGGDPFARRRARAAGLTRVEDTRQRLGNPTGRRLLDLWHAKASELCSVLAALSPDTRLKWAGLDMSVRTFTVARQMEVWMHGQTIFDLLGVKREPTDRLRNIAEIGVRTYGWSFINRQRALPGPAPSVILTAPSGETWAWHDHAPDNNVTGDALEFCQVVTQTRNVADTALTVVGAPAKEWMLIAQCFAGPPEEPPAPGQRAAPRFRG